MKIKKCAGPAFNVSIFGNTLQTATPIKRVLDKEAGSYGYLFLLTWNWSREGELAAKRMGNVRIIHVIAHCQYQNWRQLKQDTYLSIRKRKPNYEFANNFPKVQKEINSPKVPIQTFLDFIQRCHPPLMKAGLQGIFLAINFFLLYINFILFKFPFSLASYPIWNSFPFSFFSYAFVVYYF